MTRILYIHSIAMPGPEANTVNAAKMCEAFAANGCDVTLAVVPGAPAERLQDEIRVHYGLSEAVRIAPLPASNARPVLAAISAAGLARAHTPDLVYTRTPHAALAACAVKIPTVLELHTDLGAFSTIGRWTAANAARQPALRAIVAISQALAAYLNERLRARAPIIVAHDGADAREAAPPPSNARLRAGFAGSFYRGKGLELIARLAALCPWADFELLGGDADAAVRIMETHPPNVRVRGAAPHARVAEFIDGCDVALAPYQRRVIVADGCTDAAAWMSPLKIFEYMAAGKAILASDLPVLREILKDGETALLLPPDEPGTWAQAMRTLRDDTALRRRLGQQARAVFLARHTWSQRARLILEASGCASRTPAINSGRGPQPAPA